MSGAGMADLVAEALDGSDGGDDDMEKRIDQALACPCIGDLKEGPCGPTFVHAFSCFIRSDHEEKGMDCLPQFAAFQQCLRENPAHVDQIMTDAEDVLEAAEADKDVEDAVQSTGQQRQQQEQPR